MKSLADNLVITSYKIIDTPNTVSIDSSGKKAVYEIEYYNFPNVLLVIILLLIIVTICYYCIKHWLK